MSKLVKKKKNYIHNSILIVVILIVYKNNFDTMVIKTIMWWYIYLGGKCREAGRIMIAWSHRVKYFFVQKLHPFVISLSTATVKWTSLHHVKGVRRLTRRVATVLYVFTSSIRRKIPSWRLNWGRYHPLRVGLIRSTLMLNYLWTRSCFLEYTT